MHVKQSEDSRQLIVNNTQDCKANLSNYYFSSGQKLQFYGGIYWLVNAKLCQYWCIFLCDAKETVTVLIILNQVDNNTLGWLDA